MSAIYIAIGTLSEKMIKRHFQEMVNSTHQEFLLSFADTEKVTVVMLDIAFVQKGQYDHVLIKIFGHS